MSPIKGISGSNTHEDVYPCNDMLQKQYKVAFLLNEAKKNLFPGIINHFNLSETEIVVVFNKVGNWQEVMQKIKLYYPFAMNHTIKKSNIGYHSLQNLVNDFREKFK